MKITIIGAGYVGLVQAVCLADFGFIVTCVEKDTEKLRKLKGIPFDKELRADFTKIAEKYKVKVNV